MKIKVEKVDAGVPVTVMALQGELDASNFKQAIAQAETLYQDGTRNLLLDLSRLSFLSSSGIVALHSIALIMRGEQPPTPEIGWGVYRSVDDDSDVREGPEAHYKLLKPQPRVARTLAMSGLTNLVSIFEDREAALASFNNAGA